MISTEVLDHRSLASEVGASQQHGAVVAGHELELRT
jgi:hypothetical protein